MRPPSAPFYPTSPLVVAPPAAVFNPQGEMSWSSPHGTPLPDWRSRTVVMAIMNLTPDSFSDGVAIMSPDSALRRAELLLNEGAEVLDLGAESTRPGAMPVDAATELSRLLPVIAALRRRFPAAVLSVDTYKAEVARAAVAAGADLVNDVEGGRFGARGMESPMASACAALRCPLILMHRRPAAAYTDFWSEVTDDLRTSIRRALAAGLPAEQIWTDPGFGFGKTPAQNLALVRNLERISALGFPVMLGASRKSTLGAVLQETDPLQREPGNIAAMVWGVSRGCSMIRTHAVAEIQPYLRMAEAMRRGQNWQAEES